MAKSRVVYSADQGNLCPGCRQPVKQCRCRASSPTTGDGIVRLQRQTKGRNGKPVTLITGLGLDEQALKALAKDLKNRCGVGGSIEGFDILIQGDKRPQIKEMLEERGFTVKLAGG